ncbi:MAG: TlpA disulfide reductase family protein [Bacteroidota bacterium]|nr:TlpA disulfide reductase family protein [Bacteroidota bacterium]
MNRIACIVFCLLCLLFAINSNGQDTQWNNYSINGTIKGIDSGTVRMLSIDNNTVLDSSNIRNSRFFMHGKLNTPERLVFNVSPGNWNFRVFVENAAITLLIDTTGAQHYGKENNKWSLIWNIDERGSNLSNVYQQFIDETNFKYFSSITSSLHEKLNANENDTIAKAKISIEIDSALHQMNKAQKVWIENYINKNSSSIAGVYIFYEYYNQPLSAITPSYLDSVLHIFCGLAKSSVYYDELSKVVLKLKNLRPHMPVPDFTLLQRNKSPFKLSSKKGNYILIDFWASWCAPCRKAIPFWKEIYSKYKNKGLTIISISDDKEWNDWINALNKEQMPWTQLIDKFPDKNNPAIVADKFGVKTFPFYVLIDKEGKTIISSGEQDIIKKKIEEIF